MKYIDTIIDKYLAYPIVIDFMISLLIWVGCKRITLDGLVLIDKKNQIEIISNLINTNVSLAGFSLAALTIIVSIKSNLISKLPKEASNALELIFATKHYNSIVKVFQGSLIEFVINFVILFIVWGLADNLSITSINIFNIIGIYVVTMAISRSLFVLFMILRLLQDE